MRKSIVCIALLALAGAAAHATPPDIPPGHNYGGTANQHVGITNVNAALSGSRSDARSSSRSNSRSAAAATGGSAAGGSATGGSALGGTSTSTLQLSGAQLGGGYLDLSGARLGSGDTNIPRQTPPSYAPSASAPVVSCRLTMGSGGASDRYSLSLGFPIGNDGTCLHGKRAEAMAAANARRPGAVVFSDEDFLRNDCTLEGMDTTSACKALKERDQQRESAPAARTSTASTASLNLLP
jgi:hypothetical protein